jgi:hypothetical protein
MAAEPHSRRRTMADKLDVTAEAQGRIDAEKYLEALALREDVRQLGLVQLLEGVEAALRGHKIQWAVAIELQDPKDKNAILDSTVSLLKRKAAIQKQLEGTP